MPNLLAHNLLVRKLYDEVSQDEDFSNSFLDKHLDYLKIGSQGPDPLFFLGLVPSRGLHPFLALKKMGNQLHKSDGKKLFELMFNDFYNLNDDVPRKTFASFILGQLSHYLLDTTAHPFIYYQSGFDNNGHVSGKYHYQHAFYESNIDLCLAEKFQYFTFKENPSEILNVNIRVLRECDSYLNPVLVTYFNLKKLPKRAYENAYKNMSYFWKSMNLPSGKFKSILIPKSISLKGMYLPKDKDSSVLNEERNTWLDPESGKEYDYSFLDLFQIAYEKLKLAYYSLLKNGLNYTSISDFFDKDYSGVSIGGVKKYKKNS